MLGWTEEQFLHSSLRHIIKQIDIHVKINSPKNGDTKENNSKSNNNKQSRKVCYKVLD